MDKRGRDFSPGELYDADYGGDFAFAGECLFALICEMHFAICEREEGVVFAHAYVLAGQVNCAPLTDDYRPRLGYLPIAKFNTQILGLGVA